MMVLEKRKRNEKGQFRKGLPPWNKGLKNVNNTHPNSTSYKKGKAHPKYKPIGSERIDKDGLVVIKVAERKWMTKHKHLWEKEKGPVPKGHVIIFANGDKRDFSSENLICVSRKQLMALNKNKLIKNDIEITKTGVILADLLLATGDAEREVDQRDNKRNERKAMDQR